MGGPELKFLEKARRGEGLVLGSSVAESRPLDSISLGVGHTLL